jgi:hypothetical protein
VSHLRFYLAIGALIAISFLACISILSKRSEVEPLHRSGRGMPKTSQQFDTDGGQEMKPRWNE